MRKPVCTAATALLTLLFAAPPTRAADLTGTWEGSTTDGIRMTAVLNPDGSGTLDGDPITHSSTDTHLIITDAGEPTRYAYKLTGAQLTISGGDLDSPVTFTRKSASGVVASATTPTPPTPNTPSPTNAPTGLGSLLQPAAPTISGTWTYTAPTGVKLSMSLNPDHTGSLNAIPLTWKHADNTLTVTMNGANTRYAANLNNDSLTLTGGDLPTPVTFTRPPQVATPSGGGTSVPLQTPSPNTNGTTPAPAQPNQQHSVEGDWDSPEGLVRLSPGGAGMKAGQPFRWSLEPGFLVCTNDEGFIKFPYKFDANGNLVLGTGPTVTLTRAALPAGVYVATEASVDPTIVMTNTQYITLYPNGTIGYAKSEGGANRTAISDQLERFSSFKNNVNPGRTFGRWSAQNNTITIQFQGIFSNRTIQTRLDPATLTLRLPNTGVLEEGATLEFKRQ